MSQDVVLSNGRIYTVDATDSVVDSLVIRSGRILAAGPEADVSALAGPGATRVDLGGRTVIPGLIDSHLHLLSYGLSLRSVDLHAARSVEQALDSVRSTAERSQPGAWIQGHGWDRNQFGRLPTREELDRVAPGNPVMLASRDLHALWVNSLALDRAGIGPDTEDPAGGEIARDSVTGLPTGVLRESARTPLFSAVPPPSDAECLSAIQEALENATGKGLTSIQTFESAGTLGALQQLRSEGRIRARVCCHLWKEGLDHALALGLRSGFGDEWLRIGHLKLFLDGALGSRTALMLAPYSGTGDRGIQTMDRHDFMDTVIRAARGGIAVAIHAIGDAANRMAIEVLEETSAVWRSAGLRPRVEHVQLLAPGDADRLGRLGVIASMQPIHATSDRLVAEELWEGRTGLAYAWRSVVAAGAPIAFGSDCPVEPIDPMRGLYAAVTRQTAEGEPAGGWHPEQCLSPLEALRAYTIGAAFSSGEEEVKGSLESGKLADLTVLSADPFTGPADLFRTVQVEATIVGGRTVYGTL